MRIRSRRIAYAAASVIVISFAMCHAGVRYDIAQLPPSVRSRMSDTDWIGVRWVAAAVVLQAAAAAGLVVSFLVRFRERRRENGERR